MSSPGGMSEDEGSIADDSQSDSSSMGSRPNKNIRPPNDDNDFEFGESYDSNSMPPGSTSSNQKGQSPKSQAIRPNNSAGSRGGNSSAQGPRTQTHTDKPYDEAVELEDDEDEGVSTPDSGSPANTSPAQPVARPQVQETKPTSADSKVMPTSQKLVPQPPQGQAAQQTLSSHQQSLAGANESSSSEDDDDNEDSDDNEEDEDNDKPQGAYSPSQYHDLNVGNDVRELFQYIGRYKPHKIELDAKLKPFIPDFIPALGEVDAMIKIPRPDGKPDGLGLYKVDEPALTQSVPTVLELQLRMLSKKGTLEPAIVGTIENAEKNPKEVAKWMQEIAKLHSTKPPPTVQYSKRMPDIEHLMQEWPADFEAFLDSNPDCLPTSELDMDLKDYVRLICVLLDIPCYANIVESIHVMFTLYSEFKNNPHFKKQQELGGGGVKEEVLTLDGKGNSTGTASPSLR